MDFGSEYVYRYSDSEEEEISADAIETGVDSVPGAVGPTLLAPARGARHVHVHDVAPPRPPRQHSSRNAAGQKWRRADTNVVVVKFDCLTEPSNMHTGDPIVCSGCQVMLSQISRISEHETKTIWTCEFCETKNEVEIVSEEIPSKADVTYMLEPAIVAVASDEAGPSGKTELPESIVVFCIDYSGSMATVVAGTGNKRITRLDGVKRAVCHQLERLSDSDPGCRIAVVAFESSVKVIADGKDVREYRVSDDIFYDKTKLLEVATHLSLPSRISDSQKTLTQNVLREPTQGGTALGPGLLVSVGIARQMARSKVIICTDGEANEGLGSLITRQYQMGQQDDDADAFYTDVANIAKESGVSVSVLTIAGTNCKLVELGRVAELTGGQVNIVDPRTATEEFGNILENAIIATHATARFFLHRDLYVRGEPDRPSHALRDVGNVVGGAEISFEYGIRPKKKPDGCKGPKKDNVDDDKRDKPGDKSVAVAATEPTTLPLVQEPSASVPKDETLKHRLPFQVQIRYTDSKGAKAVRVFTETKAVTKDRKVAESKMNIPILGTHAIRDASDKAIQGQYMNSRLTDCAYTEMFQRNAIKAETQESIRNEKMLQYYVDLINASCKALRQSEPLSNAYGRYERASRQVQSSVVQAQRAEARSRNSTVMDTEKMMQNMGSDEVRKKRRQMFTDEFAEGCYQGMKVSSSTFDAIEAKPKSASSVSKPPSAP